MKHFDELLHHETGGSVYLTQLVLERLWESYINSSGTVIFPDEIEKILSIIVSRSNTNSHFTNLYNIITGNPKIHQGVLQAVMRQSVDPSLQGALQLIGVTDRNRGFRNPIYSRVFGSGCPLDLISPQPTKSIRYLFSDYEFNTKHYTLRRNEIPVPLQTRIYSLLHYLIKNRDRVVSKQELSENVWPNQFVSNAAMESALRLLRRALDDNGRDQRLIQTVFGDGYRFVAPVIERIETEPVPVASILQPEPEPLEESWTCPMCQHVNLFDTDIGNQFCIECGTPLQALCPHCGQNNPPRREFCAFCATSLSHSDALEYPPPSRPSLADAERRQLTILFCDLVGTAYLSGQLEPEDYRDVVHAFYESCAQVISQYDGYIAQYHNDGLLVYFGYPRAHEDDARRAILAGLDLLTAIDTLNHRLPREQAVEIAVRIGVHTGLVLVDERGDASRLGHLALGEALNVVSRLPDLAIPGTVIVSEATYRLTQGFFVCEALGDFQLKGRLKSLSVYRIMKASGAQSRFDVALSRGLTPLVGREQEIEMILERWEQVKEGQGHVVVLSGEVGIGKTRLLQELKNRLVDQALILECRCLPYHQGTAFHPLIDFLQQTLHWRDDEPSIIKQQKIETYVSQYRLPQAESVFLLTTLLSLPLPDEQYPPVDNASDQQQQRQQILEMLLALLIEQAKQQPIVFVVEDLHWSDPSTLAFLDLLIEQSPSVAILTVLTCRLTFTLPWGFRRHITSLALSRLSRAQVEAIITGATRGKPLPSEVVDQLVVKTDGVPLFVEELTKTVMEESDWSDQSPLPALEIPATLQASLMARLDRLTLGKEVAQLAATIGRNFSYDLLRAVAPWEDSDLQEGLRQIVEAELCYQQGVLPQATYQFKHALIQDAAYDSLLRSRRRQIHGEIARVLQEDSSGFPDREPETIARHLEAAQEIEEAIAYWERAAQQARQRSAHQESASHFVHAINLLSSIEKASDRAEHELRLRVELAGQLIACYGVGAPEVEENSERIRSLQR